MLSSVLCTITEDTADSMTLGTGFFTESFRTNFFRSVSVHFTQFQIEFIKLLKKV